MPQKKSKRIFYYIFLFFLIGSLNNKNFENLNFANINSINIVGLDKTNKINLLNDLNFIKNKNLFSLNNLQISKIIDSNNLVEKFSIFKIYPQTLNIDIKQTTFLAQTEKDGNNFFLGSNGKLIQKNELEKDVPFIFGKFEIRSFFKLKKAIDETNLKYEEVKDLLYFQSGRWDIKFKNDILLRLPKNRINDNLKIYLKILENENFTKIKIVDLRQQNQVIINE